MSDSYSIKFPCYYCLIVYHTTEVAAQLGCMKEKNMRIEKLSTKWTKHLIKKIHVRSNCINYPEKHYEPELQHIHLMHELDASLIL